MSDKSQRRIVIRHVSGSKANQVQQIPLKKTREITFGRDPSSTIAFDQQRDDVVSRHHAVIRVEGDDNNPAFKLSDSGSSNGTFLNGAPVTGEVELAPDDILELGEGGPKLSFDVQPRPESFASRTRVIDPLDATATRVIVPAPADGATREAVVFSAAEPPAVEPVKAGVGKNTVLHMLSQERKSTSRVWMMALATVVVVLCAVGYGFYRHSMSEAAQQAQSIQKNADRMVAEKLGTMGKSAKQIDEKYRSTVVYLELQWRLFDQATGKPVYQKVVKTREGHSYPGFVKLPDGSYARWLTLDDGNRTNLPIREALSGSGFVVGEQGFLLTNKHVAAGWLIPYTEFGQSANYDKGAVYTYGSNKNTLQILGLDSNIFAGLKRWIPATGAPVFSDNATYIGGENDNKHTFTGRNETLEVRFPSNRIGIQASLVRASTDADVALVKIDAAQALKKVELASASDQIQVGDRVMALGYPAVSAKTYVEMETVQGGRVERVDEFIPEPSLTEGIVMRLGSHLHKEGEATVYGTMDDAIQLSINATGAGNSGGPVFNDKGRVIGLFTYKGRDNQGTQVTYAVPIRHGLSLLQPQQAGAD